MQKNWNVQFKQQDRERVNLDPREVDNSGSCSEGRRVEGEKTNLFKKFKTTRAKYPRSQNVNSSRKLRASLFMYNKLLVVTQKVTIWRDLNL